MKKLSFFAVLVLLLTSTVFAAPGDVLYEADWSGGLDGWAGGPPDWKTINGMLVNDGTNNSPEKWISAPYEPGSIADYAVEAEIQVVRLTDNSCGDPSFGIVARAEQQGAYWVGVKYEWNFFEMVGSVRASAMPMNDCGNTTYLAEQAFEPSTDWHTYRVEVQANTIKLLVDGARMLETTDNLHLSGGRVGLWSKDTVLNVRSFKVIQL
jgi:hypothetical protein